MRAALGQADPDAPAEPTGCADHDDAKHAFGPGQIEPPGFGTGHFLAVIVKSFHTGIDLIAEGLRVARHFDNEIQVGTDVQTDQ